jgi:hypothetical protein
MQVTITFVVIKQAEREAGQSSPRGAEFKNGLS